MSRRDLPDDGTPADPDDEIEYVYEPPRWWNADLRSTPAIAVGLTVGTLVIIFVLVFALNGQRAAQEPEFVYTPPPTGYVPAPKARVNVEPGTLCTISNLRKSNGALGVINGFGGQPALMFDFEFPQGEQPAGVPLLVAVVTVPGKRPVTATLSPLLDGNGTVSVVPIDTLNAFPVGTTLYLGNHIDEGPDGLPRRISNVLTLE